MWINFRRFKKTTCYYDMPRNSGNNGSSNRSQRRNRQNRWRSETQPNSPELDMVTYPSLSCYKILVGNYGVKSFCKEVHSYMLYHNELPESSDDSDSPDTDIGISVDQLMEIMLVCHVVRCYTVGILLGYLQNTDETLIALLRDLRDVKLPSILCEYIEAIGSFQLENGITVVPWLTNLNDFYASNLGQFKPHEELLHKKTIDTHLHLRFFFKSSNPLLQLRNIDWDNPNGSIQMIISTESANHEMFGISPQKCSGSEALKGIFYNFRRSSERMEWPADTSTVCHNFFRSESIRYSLLTTFYFSSNNDSYTVFPKRYRYNVLIGNYGIEYLCRLVYNRLQAECYFLPLSLDELIYIMIICHMVRCNSSFKCYKIPNDLEKMLTNLQLPSILCTYIETIGEVDLKNGINVLPWLAPKAEFYSSELAQLSPEVVLQRAGRPIPEDNIWCIDYEWIINIIQISHTISTRSKFLSLKSRKIKWENKTGNIAMLITCMENHDSGVTLIPTSPEKCSEIEAHQGALFNYRQFSKQSSWPEDTSLVCQDFFRAGGFIPGIVVDRCFTN